MDACVYFLSRKYYLIQKSTYSVVVQYHFEISVLQLWLNYFWSVDSSILPFYSPTHLSIERSWNGRFLFSPSREVFCVRLYICILMHVFPSSLLLLFRCSMYLWVCMDLCTHKLPLIWVICCNNLATFICIGGLVIFLLNLINGSMC